MLKVNNKDIRRRYGIFIVSFNEMLNLPKFYRELGIKTLIK